MTIPFPCRNKPVSGTSRRRFRIPLACALLAPSLLTLAASPFAPPASIALREAEPAKALTVTNNQPFAIREMLTFPVDAASEEAAFVVEETPAGGGVKPPRALQLYRADKRIFAWLDVALEAGASARYAVRPGEAPKRAKTLVVEEAGTFASGLPSAFRLGAGKGSELAVFDLLVVEAVKELEKFHTDREANVRAALEESAREGKLQFRKTATLAGPTLAEFHYEAQGGRFNDYTLKVVHRVHASGAIDTGVTVGTRALRNPETYLAIAKRLPASSGSGAVVDWKGEKIALPPGGASPPRTLRTQNWTRDVNWLAFGSEPGGKLTRPLVAKFSPNLARVHEETLKNANDFLVNEYAVGTEEGWTLLSEIARDQVALEAYIARQFVPPAEDETVALEFRTLPPGDYNAKTVDGILVSFAGYQGARATGPGEVEIDIGVAGVQFGTNYFPNATFGENFEFWRSAGLSGGSPGRGLHRWWPLFRHWKFFKEEIRRDLRIINSLGIDWFRIHYNHSPSIREDFVQTPEGAWMLEYLDFMAATARECGLGILFDFSLSPGDAAVIARRYGDVIQYYEIQNEVLLIPGAKLEFFDYWREVRGRIHKERPEAPVFVTGGGQQPYALLDSLGHRGVEFDAVGQHSYVDRRETPSYFRDIAIALGGYAAKHGKLPINTEYNWRMITRETEEAQAEHFSEISDCLLQPQAIPVVFQFQFQETFCVPPRTRGALRHYEPLRVDRTPKPQTFAFKESIRKYGGAGNRLRHLDIRISGADLAPGKNFTYEATIENVSQRPLALKLTPRLPEGFTSKGEEWTFKLRSGEKRVVTRTAQAPVELKPGIYHFFEEARFDEDVLFGWGIARHSAKPQLDLAQLLLKGVEYEGGVGMLDKFDLSLVASSAFGEEAPALEVDWALYLYHSLRSATGSPVTREKDTTLSPAEGAKKNLVVVGTPSSNELVKAVEGQLPPSFAKLQRNTGLVTLVDAPLGNKGVTWLVVTGADANGVERAASDLLYRYWRFAKDAASFRKGMPPIEGSWTTDEPERRPPSENMNDSRSPAGESIGLQVPKVIRAGEDFRVIAINSSEPPGPAGGARVNVSRDRKCVQTGVSTATGDVAFRLDEPGEYEIHVEGVPSTATRITVSPSNPSRSP